MPTIAELYPDPVVLQVTDNEGRGTDINYTDMDVERGIIFPNDGWVGCMCELPPDAVNPVTIQCHYAAKVDSDLDVVPKSEVMQPGKEYFFGLFPTRWNREDGCILVTSDGPIRVAPFRIKGAF